MVKNLCETPNRPSAEDPEQPEKRSAGCRAFSKLKAWQIHQYRSAVDENKWYISERAGREVAWHDAERDFQHNEFYGCAPKWRTEFCTNLCSHFTSCSLGQNFCEKD